MKHKSTLQTATVLGFILALTAVTYARKFSLTASSKVPAASGEINAKTDKNDNTEVELKVQNLAKPGSLTPPATSYVVWFESQGLPPENEGELKVGDNLKGEVKDTTPSKNFDVVVTAESDPLAKSPSDDVILRAKVQM
jgi:hypothetical protein